jgi:hypothetical protein
MVLDWKPGESLSLSVTGNDANTIERDNTNTNSSRETDLLIVS